MRASEVALSVGAVSEQGHRDENQDRMTGFKTAWGFVYLVADGMGGHRGGAEASRLVVKGFERELAAATGEAPLEQTLKAGTLAVNADLLLAGGAGDPMLRGMGSTVVLLAIRALGGGLEFTVGHVGDSRAYLLRGGALRRLTSDHSMVQRLVDEGLLQPSEAEHHPQSNVLSRALGQERDVTMDVAVPDALIPGDMVMLCTDGLWGSVPDAEIAAVMQAGPTPAEIAGALVQRALALGSDDNITVQVVQLPGSATVPVGQTARTVAEAALPIAAMEAAAAPLSHRRTMTSGTRPAAVPAKLPSAATVLARRGAGTSWALVLGLLLVVCGAVLLGLRHWRPDLLPAALGGAKTTAPVVRPVMVPVQPPFTPRDVKPPRPERDVDPPVRLVPAPHEVPRTASPLRPAAVPAPIVRQDPPAERVNVLVNPNPEKVLKQKPAEGQPAKPPLIFPDTQ